MVDIEMWSKLKKLHENFQHLKAESDISRPKQSSRDFIYLKTFYVPDIGMQISFT